MDSPLAKPSSSGRRWIGIVAVAVVLLSLVVIALCLASKNSPEPALVWLDPVQFTAQMQPGRLKKMYYKVLNLAAPLLKHLISPKKQLVIDARVFASHGTPIDELQVGTPIGTNEMGARAWILSASELQGLRRRIEASRNVALVNSPRMTLADGTRASMSDIQTAPQGMTFVGVSLDMYPKIVSHQFELNLNAVYTEPGEAVATVKTNISATCRVVVPNGGGILVSSPDTRQPLSTNYWIILSPTAIDAAGKAIRL